MLTIHHNFAPEQFLWLWAKYVRSFNPSKHCTNCIPGRYSRKFSKASNPELKNQRTIDFDEFSDFKAIYMCGVSKKGYSTHSNYPHNVHIPILPKVGVSDFYEFEGWRVQITDGILIPIPRIDELPAALQRMPDPFITCRIFRWAAGFLGAPPEHDLARPSQ